jgi:hypothetical protein
VIKLAKLGYQQIYEKIIFFGPVITVIVLAAFLVYCTYLANFIVTAAVVVEEGTGTEAASAGAINALTFIIPAIVGGFLIALLFKYRKKVTLKFFFGGALFFAGSFIIYFFAGSVLYIIQTQFYSLFILEFNPDIITIIDLEPVIYLDIIYPILLFSCGFLGFWMTYVISSKRFNKPAKNRAILLQSALMGAFLSVILPTFTVVILLVGLSLYDIYSVRRGPIKDIVRYTMEDEMKYYHEKNMNLRSSELNIFNKISRNKVKLFHKISYIFNNIFCAKSDRSYGENDFEYEMEARANNIQADQDKKLKIPNRRRSRLKKRFKLYKSTNIDEDDEIDSLLTSMTYSSRDWDVGIGDLVFYSMLASQPLTPYFIFTHGLGLLETHGLWIFWLISICTVIGILIGFVITIRLLERNSMLPGLPCSIGLGLTGFIGSTLILSFI